MHAYGDESGHLRNLLTGDGDVFVLAVVAGDQYDCGACPKQAVRRVSSLDEAKWSDLTGVQKRRIVDCFSDRDLSYGYIVLERPDLHDLDGSYLLYQDQAFESSWDLSVIGHGYAYLLKNMIGAEERVDFTFDRLFGRAQSDEITRTISETRANMTVQHRTSHSTRGIQAADCVAGLVGDEYRHGTEWTGELSGRITDLFTGFLGYVDDLLTLLTARE